MSEVTGVYGVACDAEDGEVEGEAVDEPEEGLDDADAVYESPEEFGGEDGVFFDELGEIVEAGGDGEGEEAEAYEEA